ncbi:MAG: ribosomal RNA small subunit methyltransferase A [Deltaproteobacteria bacterium]|nr:ribosomal RNA small subunit methyltransferase A [Deltaproteobacteria bacterium]
MARRLNIRQLLRKHGLRPKRSWSQSFLVDAAVLAEIAAAVEAKEHETVIELGAGLGALTALLARDAGRVVAVERDRDLAKVLRGELAGDSRIEILEANAARLDYQALREGDEKLVVVGNLPYHMASQILFHLLGSRAHFSRCLLMFQKEMGQRIVSPPGSRIYGVLSVLVQMRADAELALEIAPEAFFPVPAVRSQLLRITPLSGLRHPVADERLFAGLTRSLFARRRKMVRNGLRAFLHCDAGEASRILESCGIADDIRPERLSLAQLARLSDLLAELGAGQ